MGQTEVTQVAYERVIGSNPSHFKGPSLPVERISWNDARAYCSAVGMRLPTEAEWEYAARAGNQSTRYGTPDGVAWYSGNSGQKTHETGQKQPNGFGLYDMLGNVWEWVSDWWHWEYDSPGASYDPQGPSSGDFRALRGGAWGCNPSGVRLSIRSKYMAEYRDDIIGVRCVGE